ncbi:CDP-glycerol:poly-glycerophosphate transferase [Xylanimonas cellulosilytica DSM 15894]|uniref:CDP-glycerol:poly-glycerophosphate transferase n=1 Tax=Xylanimonas cellulosilytica (strain DSM 15894 / JCM 12276 / CECT 5975 / KCTC 9989 / LMG 20990 / NBRC 107835 / XIL07) TaxID=446471 RepID=D1BX36_XYLCX|nr:CDP-glycerol--poly-glycerophosphate transferase [Xylanimonas cellulosilytica]ACZ31604.1 CDP-glycerol:poly-glycerophosphate transferase [Xylanimonas cellulosilytica DSM 15894]
MFISCRVDDVRWERVNLHLTVTASLVPEQAQPSRWAGVEFAVADDEAALERLTFTLETRTASFPLEVVGRTADGAYHLRVNVTNVADRHEIPDGTWRIRPWLDGMICPSCTFDPAQAHRLPAMSKTFPYYGGRYAYMVHADLSEHLVHPLFRLKVRNYARPPKWRALRGGPASRLAKWTFDRGVLQWFFQVMYRLFRAVRPRWGRQRILLAAQLRTDIRDNMLVLKRRLIERGMDQEFRIDESVHWKYRNLFHSLWQWIVLSRKFAWADYVFLDDWCSLMSYTRLDPATVVTQLWHAGHGVKAVGLARFGMHGSPRLDNPHRRYTYGIVGSTGLQEIYAEDFGMEKENLLPTGVLRIDELLDPARIEAARTQFAATYPELAAKRVVLFAPTFRGRGSSTASYDFSLLDFEALHAWCGEDTVVLFRMHPYVTRKLTDADGTYRGFIPEGLTDRLVDASGYPSTNDLLHVTDVLVTDYSSICYEFSYLDRPMIFFAPDEVAYSVSRGFHDGFRDVVPGKTVATFDELLRALDAGDYETWRRDRYREQFCGPADTHNADRAIDAVIYGKRPVAS